MQARSFAHFKPVIQEEQTGCGIAAVANIVGKSYLEIKNLANQMGIYATDQSLWSDTAYVRHLLAQFHCVCDKAETPFKDWDSLPDTALLAIKHHQTEGKNFWHWVVFKRIAGESRVIDSASYLTNNLRQDFADMQPKWYIAVHFSVHTV